MMLRIECDGSSLKGSGAGAGFVSSDGYSEAIPLPKGSTNNEAEYQAVIGALKYLLRLRPQRPETQILSDSELVVKQINGDYKVKNSRLQKLHKEAHSLIERASFNGHITFKHIPREENARADGISRVAALISMAQEL
jgi:ribonuclease HI